MTSTELLDTIILKLDRGKLPLALFLDLSKAFDSLDFCAHSNRQRKSGEFKILNAYERINVHARRPLETHRAR